MKSNEKDKQSVKKRTIPHIIKTIGEEDNEELIGIYENIMVGMYASLLLTFASIINLIVRYYLLMEDLNTCLWASFILLIMAAAYEITTRINLKSHTMTLVISLLSFISTLYICYEFYDIIGPAVWTAAFIQVLISMTRITKMMLYFLTSAIVIANMAVFYHFYHSYDILYYHMDALYYITQIALFIVIWIISSAVHNINTDRYSKIRLQYKEAKEKNDHISFFYEKALASEKENKYLAYHDHLTGLPNRKSLVEKIDQKILAPNHMEKPFAIMFLDLDNFKMVNDSMGHAAGDQLLKDAAGRLAQILGQNNIVSRIGGDEFIIFIENIEDNDTIKQISRAILDDFHQPFILDNKEFYVTTSVGVAIYPSDGRDAEMLIRNADIAMYKAKAKCGNQCVVCNNEIKNKGIENMVLSNHLYCALEKNELELYYQPQYNSHSGKIIGVEALLRWNNPEFGMVTPDKFISIAENTGLIIPIGKWVLSTACRQNKIWQDEGLCRIPIAVNLSIRQFQDKNLASQVKEILSETDLDPQYLDLEITESIVMKEPDYIIETLEAFKDMGITISIDDFGIEYSCLNYLKRLPIDKIKIAMPFIHGININDKDEAITKAVILLAKNMGLRVVAEGVETEVQLSFLSQRMCDEIQGYYYYKPMPAHEIKNLFAQTSTGAAI